MTTDKTPNTAIMDTTTVNVVMTLRQAVECFRALELYAIRLDKDADDMERIGVPESAKQHRELARRNRELAHYFISMAQEEKNKLTTL